MSTETIKTGWLKDKNGNKFAPKTLTSQVQTGDGTLLEDKIQDDLNAAKAEILDSIAENIDLSEYETTEDAQDKLAEAKSYADTAAAAVKDDLLNGAGEAYDTLKELGDLITENADALQALETVATGKADKADVTALQGLVGETAVSEQISTAIASSGVVLYTEQELTDEQRKQARRNIAEVQYDWHEVVGYGGTYTLADFGVYWGNSEFDIEGAMNLTSTVLSTYSALGCLHGCVSRLWSQADIEANIAAWMPRIIPDFESISNAGLLPNTSMSICAKSRARDNIQLIYSIGSIDGNYTHFVQFYSPISNTDIGVIYYNNNTGEYSASRHIGAVQGNASTDETLSLHFYAADAKAVGEALATKADSSHTHDDRYYTETEVDTLLSSKSDTTHNHDSAYDIKGSANTALDSAKSYTDSKTSGLASTSTVETNISTHNTSDSAHNDIRDLITDLTTRLNTLANSDDTTLDQMSEVVAYIKNNNDLIEGITTSKVNVEDIVNNLTTNVSNKPLSAAQGVALKGLIDALQTAFDEHAHGVADISGLQAALDGKATSGHNHDDKYYTEAEVDDMLNGKSQVQIITWGADD